MTSKDDEFLKKLRATFRVEADEHVQAISAGLLQLEKAPAHEAQRKIVEAVFRAAHSLKGAARAVDFSAIESLCQSLEDVFASWKRQQSAPSTDALDTVHRTLDRIIAALAAPAGPQATVAPTKAASLHQPPRPPKASPPPPAEMDSTAGAQAPAPQPARPVPTERQAISEETVRIAVTKLEARLLKAEELLAAKSAAGQRVADLRELMEQFEAWRNTWTEIGADVRLLRRPRGGAALHGTERRFSAELTRLLDCFERSFDQVKSVESRIAAQKRAAEQDRYTVGKLVDDLLEDAKKLLLLPFATISASFPKLVRDLCRDQEKEVEFSIHGAEVEVDKRILEEMKDPLVHLLRNSVDHGIEPPDERARAGKPRHATVRLAVSQVNGNKVQIEVSDDGAGIDVRKVRESAVKRGLITAEEAERLDEAETQTLIYRSDVSTSRIVTQLSGRGLGLAIVREKTENLGGDISVESHPGAGTTFRIVLPATRATFRGIFVEAAGRLFVVPTANVERVARARPDDVRTVEGRETIPFDGRALALVQLADVLELPAVKRETGPPGGRPAIILGAGDHRVAFAVDAVLNEQEVLAKPLRKPLSRVRNVAAVTVLASGGVTPILNVADLLKSVRRVTGAQTELPAGTASAKMDARSVLVVEDSITSRMLLKTILESAGYTVKTAVDGMEAFGMLRTEHFDLVVSDVEMPRLSGFDLTARIRADAKLADLPVILVTARETREDRERGIDAGANAYIVKSSFDQSNLLEAVRRLV